MLFVASSHVMDEVSPLDLFHDCGITSFNLSIDGNYVKSGYYLLKETPETLKREGRHLPKLVVLDVYADNEEIGHLHVARDSFPFGQTKMQMARELTMDATDYTGLVIPFSLYHSRWKELQKNDFLPDINQLYGADLRYDVSYPASEVITDLNDRKEISEDKLSYVDKTKHLRDSYGITLDGAQSRQAPTWAHRRPQNASDCLMLFTSGKHTGSWIPCCRECKGQRSGRI